MNEGEEQLAAWSGDFGNEYLQRNQVTPEAINSRRKAFAEIFKNFETKPKLESILEIGCNIGINMHALAKITDALLYGVEPNEKALDLAVKNGALHKNRAHKANLESLPFDCDTVDLVFTSGVLIHIPDQSLKQAVSEIYRVSRRYILTLEYFSPTTQAIQYHGHNDFLFKRDYGGLFADAFPTLEHIASGFFWKRTTGMDNLNWWLFSKHVD